MPGPAIEPIGGTFSLSDVEALANRFAVRQLERYTQTIQLSGRSFARKEINDALWGTIGLTPIEVAILDSPLLQRLRYVRQLGVVHWIYPGAVHTRFEHTLGVLHQVHHLVTALNSVAAASGHDSADTPLISGSNAQLLRLCALLHDIGHAAFSHVSEMAIETLPTMAVVRADFSKKEGGEGKQLSEIFAFYVVRSPAMRSFLELLLDRCSPDLRYDGERQRNLDTVVAKISNAIIGRQIDDRLPLLHELISGPFDADKLDYFVRDAKLAGTPSLLDISRLVQKLTVRYFDSSELPVEIGRNVQQIVGKHCLFGIKWSGVAVLDELQLARVLLYAKIYRHPKVVAIEQMMRAAILTLAQVAPVEKLLELLYTHADDALLNMSSEVLGSSLGLAFDSLEQAKKQRLEITQRILTDVRERRLWVRAYHLALRYPSDPLAKDDLQKAGLIDLVERIEHPQLSRAFIDELIDEVQAVLQLVPQTAALSRAELDASIMLHILNSTAPGGTQIARAYVLPSKGKPIPFREYVVNRSGWADSYLSDQPKGYIFCPPELAEAVFVAMEKVVRTGNGVRLPSSALELSKRDAKAIDDLKRKLSAGGYYRNAPVDVRPIPARLQKADVRSVIEGFEQRVRSAFQEPQSGEDTLRQVPLQDRTMMWLRQFDDDRHVDCALRLLASFRLIQRDDIVEALRAFIRANPEFEGAYLVPFGSARDSSAVHTYFAADLQGTLIGRCVSMAELAEAPDDVNIIFLDDFAINGGQTIDVLAAGLGDLAERKGLEEQRSIFDDKVQKLLLSNKVGLVYAAAWDCGVDEITKAAQKWKLDAKVFRLLDETQIPFARTVLRDVDTDVVDSFLERCRNIGEQLLLSTPEELDADTQSRALEKARIGALGYGNRGMLVASTFNVPTQTLTAMWAMGEVDQVAWMPLLLRRKKT